MHRNALAAGLTLLLGAGLGGCYTEAGYFVDDTYVYVSTPWQPKTVTVYDTRTGEAFWSVDVPVGERLAVKFVEGTGPNEFRPDEIKWELMPQSRMAGPLSNRAPAPPPRARRIEMTLRAAPEIEGETPGTPAAQAGVATPDYSVIEPVQAE